MQTISVIIYILGILVLSMGLYFWYRSGSRDELRYLSLCRIPILTALVLVGLPYMAIWGPGEEMLGSLFALSGVWLSIATLLACFTAFWVRCLWRIILCHAPTEHHLQDLREKAGYKWLSRILGFILLFSPALALYALFHYAEYPNNLSPLVWMSLGIIGFLLLIPIILYIIAEKPGLSVNEGFIRCFLDEGSLAEKSLHFIGFKPLARQSANGEPKPKTRLHKIKLKMKEKPGHATMAILGFLAFLYFAFAGAWFPWSPLSIHSLPALISLLIMIIIAAYVLTYCTFFCDRVHIPVIVLLLLTTMISYWILDVDHYYRTKPTKGEWCSLESAVKERIEKIENKKTVILVTAAGGGIQAAAWTAGVLYCLENAIGEEFTKSIVLISAVSGGSVGTMYYLDGFDGTKEEREERREYYLEAFNLKKDNLTKEEKKPGCSWNSLDAVAWGYLYPDTVRSAGLAFLVPKHIDRGWALEEAWERDMGKKRKTFRDWEATINEGKMPVPIFNCTIVETGERLLLAPVQGLSSTKSKNFHDICPGRDIDVTTAARLSATFPYITPVARIEGEAKNKGLHIADGGYYDNYGVMTVVDLLHNSLIKKLEEKGVKKVILLQIMMSQEEGERHGGGWVSSMFGPLKTMLNVRGSTQVARNTLEINLLEKGNSIPKIKLIEVLYRGKPRLSWKLSFDDKIKMRKELEDFEKDKITLDKFEECGFTCPVKSEKPRQ